MAAPIVNVVMVARDRHVLTKQAIASLWVAGGKAS